MWTKFFGGDWPANLISRGDYFKKHCGADAAPCRISTDKRMLRSAAAVIFHMRDVKGRVLPGMTRDPRTNRTLWPRWPDQRYVFFLHESPAYTTTDLKALAGYFNWTMTYRRDSDILMTYGNIGRHQAYNGSKNYAAGKKKLVAWVVSHCKTQGKRHLYAKELAKSIPVDIYGKCGRLKCGAGAACFRMVTADYKFYLAFENSLCRDYVSEKFFRLITRDIVLVVLGGADYSRVVPRSAYIDARDFESPRHLATHLKRVAANDTLYNGYFAWRRDFAGYNDGYNQYCELCRMLHDGSGNNASVRKSYADIHDWWITRAQCRTAEALL